MSERGQGRALPLRVVTPAGLGRATPSLERLGYGERPDAGICSGRLADARRRGWKTSATVFCAVFGGSLGRVSPGRPLCAEWGVGWRWGFGVRGGLPEAGRWVRRGLRW